MNNLIFHLKNVFTFLSLVGLAVMIACCSDSPRSIRALQTDQAILSKDVQSTNTTIPPSQSTIAYTTPSVDDVEKLPFRSLTKSFRLGTSLLNPTLLLVFDNQGQENVDPLVSEDDRSLIHTVDFEKQALIAVFWGTKPAGGYSITIDNVSIIGGELVIEVMLQDNDPEFPKIEAATSPYNLVIVDKKLLVDKIKQYQMISNDVLLTSGMIP
jgi:hypothetical protein